MNSLADPGPGVDPDPRWIRIIKSLYPDPELESPESQKGPKSDSGSGSRAGIVTPLNKSQYIAPFLLEELLGDVVLLLLALDGHVLLEVLLLLVVPHREDLVVLSADPLLLAQLTLELGSQLLQLNLPLLLDPVDHLIQEKYIALYYNGVFL